MLVAVGSFALICFSLLLLLLFGQLTSTKTVEIRHQQTETVKQRFTTGSTESREQSEMGALSRDELTLSLKMR